MSPLLNSSSPPHQQHTLGIALHTTSWRAGGAVAAGDHQPIAADLSDLADVIAWCKRNDAAARAAAAKAAKAAALDDRLLSREGKLNYMHALVCAVAAHFSSHAERAAAGLAAAPHPQPLSCLLLPRSTTSSCICAITQGRPTKPDWA